MKAEPWFQKLIFSLRWLFFVIMQNIIVFGNMSKRFLTWIQVLPSVVGFDKCYEQLLAPWHGEIFSHKNLWLILTLVFLSTADAPAELNCSFPHPNTYQYQYNININTNTNTNTVSIQHQYQNHHNFCFENQPNTNQLLLTLPWKSAVSSCNGGCNLQPQISPTSTKYHCYAAYEITMQSFRW